MTGVPLRRRLFALTAAAILPLALMAGLGLSVLRAQQNAQAERVGVELSRSVAGAVDAELRSTIAVLDTLATTPRLDLDDYAGVRDRAVRILERHASWTAVVLADRHGTTLADTREDPPTTRQPLDRASFERVVRTRTPAVGNLTQQEPEGQWLFAVRVPVVRDGAVQYVLSALIRPEAIRDVLTRLQVPADWVVSIIDGNSLRVARSRAHEENVGGRLSDTAQAVVAAGGTEGFGISVTLEGERSFTPYSRLVSAPWTAVLGISTALVDAAAFRSLAVYGGGVLLSILLGTLGATWVARSIARPIAELRTAAEALGQRRTADPPLTSIQEIREVGSALRTAAGELATAEAEREDLLRKERRAREAAETADRAKEEFMAVLSHELRTPLNAVYGWARMLQGGHVTDPTMVSRAMDAIVRNADVQVQLIDDLLDLARITSGKMRLEIRTVDLGEVLDGAIDAVRPAAEAKDIRIECAIDDGVRRVTGDSARLQQVVWNLLMNAVKFTPRAGRVRLGLQGANGHVQITVSDTGQGIAPEILPHIFERFRQGDSSSTRSHGGLGLGLALVRHMAELHGGTVTAHSDGPGTGATFTVTLPRPAGSPLDGSRHPASAAPGAVPAASVSRLDGVRVLVADDDGDALALTETILSGAGAEVRTCLSAGAALQMLRSWRPDVLVSDLEMPGEDGYALIAKVRALPIEEGRHTPAIALTAYGRAKDRLRALGAGFTMHVPKPVDPGELTAIVAGVAGPTGQPWQPHLS